MNFFAVLTEKVVSLTADMIVGLALHMPFLMHALLISAAPGLISTTTPSTSIVPPSKYSADSSCPIGTMEALAQNRIRPTRMVKCKQVDQFLYDGRPAEILEITYGSTELTDFNDVSYPITVRATLFPSGDISFDKTYLDLKGIITNASGEYLLRNYPSISLNGSEFLALKGYISGTTRAGEYCGTFDTLTPFMGQVTTCLQPGASTTSIGSVVWDKSVIDFDSALSKATAYASSTFPNVPGRYISRKTGNPNEFLLERLYFNSTEKFWVFGLKNGYINSFRYIKLDAGGNTSCITSYGGYRSSCP